MAKRDQFTRSWIIENSLEIIDTYSKGVLTIRALHYRLVSRGMTNSTQHYARVKSAMTVARRDKRVDYDVFSDHERAMIGETNWEGTSVKRALPSAQRQVGLWMKNYSKNRWENQPYYPEVWIEKKALQGSFQDICSKNRVTLGACKGYPSLTFLHDASLRFYDAIEEGKKPIILYFGDYDASGENIPDVIKRNLYDDFNTDVEVRRVALMEHQVIDWGLPVAPTKQTDSRAKEWDGLGQVELDAIEPSELRRLCQESIDEIFDNSLYSDLQVQEEKERAKFQKKMKKWAKKL